MCLSIVSNVFFIVSNVVSIVYNVVYIVFNVVVNCVQCDVHCVYVYILNNGFPISLDTLDSCSLCTMV